MAVSLLFLEFWLILLIEDLTRNLETENIPAWVLSNIQRLERVKDTTFRMFLMKIYLMLQNSRFTAFTVFKLLKEIENLHGGRSTTTPRLNFKIHQNKI